VVIVGLFYCLIAKLWRKTIQQLFFLQNNLFGSLEKISTFVKIINDMTMTEKTAEILAKEVKEALDGRTNRWLALKIGMPETDISKKMRGRISFTKEEIDAINRLLNVNIEY
jgi:hypothetical protein